MANNYLEYEPGEDDLKHFREWLENRPHIIQDYDDNFLSSFIRGCKGNLQKTKSVLENFNRLGIQYPKLFGNLDPQYSNLQEHLQVTQVFPLPKKLDDGTIILMAILDPEHKSATSKFHSLEMFRYFIQWLYILLWENDYGPGKGIAILDQKNVTLTHFRDLTPIALMHLVKILQTSLPVRPQAIHLLNLSPIMTKFFNFLKVIIPKKFSNKIYFHSSMETLYEKIPKDLLPKEYGGCQESVMTLHHQWKNKVESYGERLLQENLKMRRLDHLRP